MVEWLAQNREDVSSNSLRKFFSLRRFVQCKLMSETRERSARRDKGKRTRIFHFQLHDVYLSDSMQKNKKREREKERGNREKNTVRQRYGKDCGIERKIGKSDVETIVKDLLTTKCKKDKDTLLLEGEGI